MSGTPPAISLSRTVVLPRADPSDCEELSWPAKSPATTQDYSVDVTAWADDAEETVVSFTASVLTPGSTSAPLTAAPFNVGNGSNVCSVMLAGGVSPTVCSVLFTIQTATRTLSIVIWIEVIQVSANFSGRRQWAVLGTSNDPASETQLQSLTAGLAAEVTRAEQEESTLQGSITSLSESLSNLSSSHTTLSGQVTGIGNTQVNFEQTVQNQLSAYSTTIATQNQNIAAQNATISSQGSIINSQATLIETLQASIAAMETALASAQGSITAITNGSAFGTLNTGAGGGLYFEDDYLVRGNDESNPNQSY